jgi:integrin alpha FG-GAP repeat containing protein 1
LLTDPDFRGTLPVQLKIGDYNEDGYPDLLVIASATHRPTRGRPSVLQSVPCDNHSCTKGQVGQERRTFEKLEGGAGPLDAIEDAKEASWIDIDEDVSLQLLA